jgi:hypothetical protein
MRTLKYFVMAMMTMGLAASLGMFRAAYEEKPKYDIEEIMEKAHKAPKGKANLLQQVAKGTASKEQQKQLLEYYQELAKNKPEKGDIKDWQRRTNALVKATKGVIDGKDGAGKDLMTAANCKACHQVHRGE